METQVENLQTKNEQQLSKDSESPKTNEERIEAGEPYIKVKEQIIFTKNWPKENCKHCLSTGYVGIKLDPKAAMKLGRNDKCPCGSGNKYKKCCMSMIQRMRLSGSSILTCECVGKGSTLGANPDLEKLKEQLAKVM